MDVIHILIFLAGDFHQAVSDSDPVGFRLVRPFVEIAPLPVDGPLEDQRFAGVGGLDFLDKREEPFFDLLDARVREGVEDEGIYIRGHKNISEIILEFAVSAASKA